VTALTTTQVVRGMRVGAVACVLAAAFLGLTGSGAYALGPDKTAWYDNLGLQSTTGETTPSVASNGQLEVEYVPAAVSVPPVTLPTAPVTTPTLPPSAPVGVPVPSGGSVGGSTVGDTLSFAEVQYTVPLTAGSQSIDPTSIRGVLTLALDSQSSANVSSGDIVACPTSNNLWASGSDQPATQASPYDCSAGAAVTGNYDASSATITFNLSSAQEYVEPSGPTGIFSLAIVPGSSPTGPFTAVIQPPSATSFDVTGESPGSDANQNLANSGAGPPASAPAVTPTTTTPAASAFEQESAGLTGGSGVSPVSPVTPAAAPVGTPATTATTSPGAVALSAPVPTAVVSGLSSGFQRTIAVILLMSLGAGLWMAASLKRHVPKSLRPVHALPG
jgi:hypothetical protein